jgi:hypothetical protein
MKPLEPYSLSEAQSIVSDALNRMRPQHIRWAAMRRVYRTGRWGGDNPQAVSDSEGRLYESLPDVIPETLNLTLSHMNVMVPSIIDRDPQHTAVPTQGGVDSEKARHAVENLLRHLWRRTDGTGALTASTWDMALVGNGFLKIAGEMIERTTAMDPLELEQLVAQGSAAEMALAREEGREPDPDFVANSIDPFTVTDDWQPWVTHVRPEDIFVGTDCRDIKTAGWVAQRIVLPADEVEANEAYEGAFKKGLKVKTESYRSARNGDATATVSGQSGSDRPFEFAVLWEFYDMRARRLMVFQQDCDTALFDGDLPYDHQYAPFVHLGNYQDGDNFWRFGEIENIAAAQEMVNELVEEQVLNARRAGNKYILDESASTDALQAALESDEHEVVAKVKVPNGKSLRDIFQAVPRMGIPPDVLETDAMLRSGIAEILGINDFQKGGVGADRMSATAASLVEGIATIRAADKIRQVERAAAHAGQIMLMLAQQFLPDDTAINIVGKDDEEGWIMLSRSNIGGEYLVSVQPESTKALNPQARQQKALQGIQEIIPVLAEMGYDTEPALRSFLRDAGYDPEALLIKAPPPPMEPEMGGMPPGMAEVGGMMPAGDPMGLGTGAALDASSAPYPEAELTGGMQL